MRMAGKTNPTLDENHPSADRLEPARTWRGLCWSCTVFALLLLAAGSLSSILPVSAQDASKNEAVKVDEKGNVEVAGTVSSRGFLVNDGTKQTTVSVIPAGAVIAFNRETCPEGWSEYKPAYGRFIRGVDKSGEKVDPAGQRKIEDKQEDAIRNITGKVSGVSGQTNRAWPWGFRPGTSGAFTVSKEIVTYNKYAGDYTPEGGVGTDAVFDASKVVPTAEENRPKNVALLYCQKD